MAEFSWSADAPSGVFKNHALSSAIRMAAVAESKFMQFTKPEPGYGKKSGENVTISRISNITEPTSITLTEGVRIPEDNFSISTVAITVSEIGRSVPFTSFAEDLSHLDLQNSVQVKLKDQMKLGLDTLCSTAFKSAKVKAIPDGIASLTFDTDGTPSSAATVNLNMYHVEQIRDYMYGTLFVPPYEGDDYIALIATKAKRGLMSDPAWQEWHKYTDPESKYNGEVGRIENIRFIEVNHTNALSGSKGTGSVLGECVFFGQDAVAMPVVMDPELRAEANFGQDFGRSKAVAWYGVLAFGIIWDTANAGEARIVHVTSS
jgi:N4-gp56 family major capsid protein